MPSRSRSNPGLGSGPPRYPGTFLLALREALASLGWRTRRFLGSAVACADDQGREHVLGLENLFRRLRKEDRATWPELIVNFLKSVPREQWENPPEELTAVAERVLPRIGAPLRPGKDEARIWFQPLYGNTLGVSLVVDYPQSMSYVTEKMVADSSRSGEAWLEQALANLQAQTKADCLQIVEEDSGLRQCMSGDAYDSSRALLLDRLMPDHLQDGFFAALPSRDELFVLPVTQPSLRFLPLLKTVAAKTFQTAPYPISDEVFWIRAGSWLPFGVDLSHDSITLRPPESFREVWERLAPEGLEEIEPGEESPGEESDNA